ncbi:MAG TPA: nuclear transport factor 2 family protein [Micromonosporaceae bacterium]|jgi:SnoaL-like domain
MSASETVNAFRTAWEAKDLGTARMYLSDDLDFAGPIDTFDNADDYIQAITGLAHIVASTTTRRVLVDGQDVAVFYDMHTATPAGTVPIAEWYHVDSGRISMIRVYFDPRPFTPPS